MRHEGELLGVHLGDDAVEALGFELGVGRVAQHAEDQRAFGGGG